MSEKMIELYHALINEGTMIGTVTVDPHEALKALEEQAPEVLREWAMGKTEEDLLGESYDEGYRDGYQNGFDDGDYHGWEGHDQSPWIKVSDQEPPKDGSEFFYREKSNNDKWMHYALSWLEDCEMWVTGFGYENISEDIAPDGEWMPIPE